MSSTLKFETPGFVDATWKESSVRHPKFSCRLPIVSLVLVIILYHISYRIVSYITSHHILYYIILYYIILYYIILYYIILYYIIVKTDNVSTDAVLVLMRTYCDRSLSNIQRRVRVLESEQVCNVPLLSMPWSHLDPAVRYGRPTYRQLMPYKSYQTSRHYSKANGNRSRPVYVDTRLQAGRYGVRILVGPDRSDRIWGPCSVLFSGLRTIWPALVLPFIHLQ